MDNKCPKCGRKLSIFYLKQNCPDCGCDLLYYNMEENLERDAEKAEAEYAKLDRFINKVTAPLKKLKKDKNDES